MDTKHTKANAPEIEMADIRKAAERLTLYVKGVMEITVKEKEVGGENYDEQARV